MLYKLLCSFRMELLVLNDSILHDSKIPLIVLSKSNLLLFLQNVVYVFVLDIFIFDLDDILFILIDDSEQLAFYFGEMLADLIFVQEVHLLLHYQI